MTRAPTKKIVHDPETLDILTAPARARSSDPVTSKHAAVAASRKLLASQQRVLAMFRAYGEMTDETLAAYLADASKHTGIPPMSPSGLRSRRSELAKPNMDRLDEIVADELRNRDLPTDEEYERATAEAMRVARNRLRTEGFKSELWDTGRRERMTTGRMAIVWGLAR